MTDEFPYELLFRFVFPSWKGEIPPLPIEGQPAHQHSFLNSDSDQFDELNVDNFSNANEEYLGQTKIIHYDIDGYIIWEVQTENLTNLIYGKHKIQSDNNITKIIIHTINGDSIVYGDTADIHFSENCVHFLPNSSWVFSVDPFFYSEILFFDPIISLWFCNTECLEKSENLVSMNIFDQKLDNSTNLDSSTLIPHLFEVFKAIFEPLLSQPQYLKWINEIEIPHARLLGNMHQTSLFIDINKIGKEKNRLSTILSKLEKEIYAISGCEFNILSPFDVSDILFNHLHIQPPDSNPQNTFSIDSRHRVTVHKEFSSTNSMVLEKINHPIAKKILQYRKIQKIISNWLSFTDFADENGGLHPTFMVCSTATGRISTKSPNLQNIPSQQVKKGDSIPKSKENFFDTNIRSFFIPCPTNQLANDSFNSNPADDQSIFYSKCISSEYILLSLDYSQLELRILAHYSRDPSFCTLCSQPEIDLHSHIAQIIYNVNSIDLITSKQREEIKQAVYATIYGKGWTKDGIEKGQKLEAVLKTFPGIRTFVTNTTALATKDGYVQTLSGKKRLLLNIQSNNAIERKRDQRMAINTKIQGSAADFVKFALLQIMKKCGGLIEPLLQLHDEWLFRTKIKPGTKDFDDLCNSLKSSAECSDQIGLTVPIPCKITYGPSYGELLPI